MRNEETDETVTHHAHIRGWLRDLLPLGMLLISGLVWGMKLEARYDRIEERQDENKADIKALHQKIDGLQERFAIQVQITSELNRQTNRVQETLDNHIFKNGHLKGNN